MKRYLFGTHAVVEALTAHPKSVVTLLATDVSERSPHREALDLARRSGATVELRAAADLDTLSKGARHQGIVAIAGGDYPYTEFETLLRDAQRPELLVALDEITDVHNFGAITRSCVAFGAHGIITLRDRAAPVTSAVVRASAGATEHARIARVTNLSRALERVHEMGYTSVGLDVAAESALADVMLRGPIVLVVGSEGRGLRRLVREKCSTLARIPMAGTFDSLNASVAAAIALYEVHRQRTAAG